MEHHYLCHSFCQQWGNECIWWTGTICASTGTSTLFFSVIFLSLVSFHWLYSTSCRSGIFLLALQGLFLLACCLNRDFFTYPKGLAALVMYLVCPLHVYSVWPGTSYLIFLSLKKTVFQINPFMLKHCLTIDSPVCTTDRLPWGQRRRELRNVGLGNWCQSVIIWWLILS